MTGIIKKGLKGYCLKQTRLLPINLHDITAGRVLYLPFDEQANRYISFDGVDDYLTISGTPTVISFEGTATPTVSTNRIDFTAGTMSKMELSDGTIYNGSLTSDGKLKDLVGNNHATIYGAVPHDTAIDQHRAEGGMSFDGVDNYVYADNVMLGDDFDVTFKANKATIGNGDQKFIFYQDDNTNPVWQIRTGNNVGGGGLRLLLQTRVGGQYLTAYTDNDIFTDTDIHIIRVVKIGTSVVFYVDGDVKPSSGYVHENLEAGTNRLYVGSRAGINLFKGNMYSVSIISDGVTKLAYNFLRKNNDNTTVYDCSGNDNHATNNGAIYINQKNHGDIIGNVKRVNLGDLRALKKPNLEVITELDINSEEGVTLSSFVQIDYLNQIIMGVFGTNESIRVNIENSGKLFYWLVDNTPSGHLVTKPSNIYEIGDRLYLQIGYKKVATDSIEFFLAVDGRIISSGTKTYEARPGKKVKVFNNTYAQIKYGKYLSPQEIQNQYLYLKKNYCLGKKKV